MGFLMGAYGKLMTGKLVRDIQFQMIGIQSRLRRVTREIGDKEKYYQSMERNQKQQMQAQMQYGIFGACQQLGLPMGGAMYGMQGMGMFGQQMGMMAAMGGFNQQQMQMYSAISQQMQMQFMQAQTMWQNMFEMQREADLQALKDLQDDLQLQKDNLESQLQIAKQEYDAYKQEEKADVKGLVPDYTGGQG